jgi:chromosome segregation ATPase
MEFRDYAAKETSALLTRLLASQAEASLEQIRSLRDALDAAVRTVETTAGGTPQIEKDVQDLIKRLNSAAGTAARAAAQKVQDDARGLLDIAHRELESQRAKTEEIEISLAAANAQNDSLHSEISAQAERIDTLSHDITDVRAAHDQTELARQEAEAASREQADARAAAEDELRETRGLLDAALSEAARLSSQLETEAAEYSRLIGELSSVRGDLHAIEIARDGLAVERDELAVARDSAMAERDTIASERDTIAGERDALIAERTLVAAERDAAAADRNLAAAERDVIVAERDALAARLDASNARVTALESAHAERDTQIRHLEERLSAASEAESRLREGSHEGDLARSEAVTLRGDLERLAALLDGAVHAVDDLAGANSMTDLLYATVRQLSVHFSRVALFRVKGNRLEGDYQIGFDSATDVSKLVIPLNVDSVLTRAVGSRNVESLSRAELSEGRLVPFGTRAAAALAIPMSHQGDTLAVVYAEETETGDTETAAILHQSRVRFATFLIRHSAALMTRLTQELKALSELSDYAALLLKEAEEMHTADSDGGRDEDEVRRRLKDNLDCARQLFVQRASMDGPSAAGLLDEQIRTAADAQTAFGRDLAAVVGQAISTPQRNVRKANAS